jgi:hypothetical protein
MENQMKTNLLSIKALRNSTQSPSVKALLAKHLAVARREAASLRRYAALRPGRVADHCNGVAAEIEAAING